MAFSTTRSMAGGTLGLISDTGRALLPICCMATATGVSPSKGGLPVSIS